MTITLMPGRTTATTPATTTATTPADLAAAYGVTSRLVLAPADDALLATLAAPGLLEGWPLFRCSETVRGLASLHRSLVENEDRQVVAAEYRRLFAGTPALIPAPYESAYRPNERLLFDVPTFAVRDENVFGLQAPAPGRREGDHLGLELSYAGRLCLAAQEASDRGDDATADACLAAHHDFLEQHLLRWAPGCLREVEAAADTHFYRGAAALALGVLAHAHERLG